MISDGNHNGGNKDFFFLPPMVANPSGSPNWNATGFDASFVGANAPMVRICQLDATSESGVATSSCSGGALVSAPAIVNAADQQYQLNWKVPDVNATTFYRVTVVLRTNQLGAADVEVVPNASQLKNITSSDVVPLADNRTLPIKFRIEQGALNQAVAQVNLRVGGQVSTILPGWNQPSGVYIPPQGGTDDVFRTITVTSCESLNSRATDLPVFGPCVRVTSDPALTTDLAVPATVFVCDVDEGLAFTEGGITDELQAHRITLHQLDLGPENTQILKAVPHTAACTAGAPGSTTTASVSTFRGVLAQLGHGNVTAAARELADLVTPKPLHAAMFIDLGGGGRVSIFSDFQFALPARFDVEGSTVGTGSHAAVNVRVSDLGGLPVPGATVHFSASPSGSTVSQASAVTGIDGIAAVSWTPLGSADQLTASGRGIAGSDNNGPRVDVLDPFQPIQSAFDGTAPASGAVPVLTGSIVLSPSLSPPTTVDLSAGAWSYDNTAASNIPPEGWETSGGAIGWRTGTMAFGTAASCPTFTTHVVYVAHPVETPWDGTTSLMVNRSITLSASGDLSIIVNINQMMDLYLDGVRVETLSHRYGAPPPPSTSYTPWTGTGCSDANPATSFSITNVPAGPHTIAIHAWGNPSGESPYLNVKITSPPPVIY